MFLHWSENIKIPIKSLYTRGLSLTSLKTHQMSNSSVTSNCISNFKSWKTEYFLILSHKKATTLFFKFFNLLFLYCVLACECVLTFKYQNVSVDRSWDNFQEWVSYSIMSFDDHTQAQAWCGKHFYHWDIDLTSSHS